MKSEFLLSFLTTTRVRTKQEHVTWVTFMAEEQKVASVREGSQDLAPDKEMQPASEGRTWQPVLPVEPSSSPFRWGLQKARTLLQPSCHFPWNKVWGHRGESAGKAAIYWCCYLHHDLVPSWSGKTGTKDPRRWFGFFLVRKKPKNKQDCVCNGFWVNEPWALAPALPSLLLLRWLWLCLFTGSWWTWHLMF